VKTHTAVALLIAMTGPAAADGERSPMFGAAVTYTDASDRKVELVGGALELVWWWRSFGVGIEAAARRGVVDDDARNLSAAGSARVLIADWLAPSLIDPSDVELGVELQAIAERTWWGRDDASSALGLGAAVRMRGGSDWVFSRLLAESRLFVRVMQPRDGANDSVARAAMPTEPAERRALTVIVGLGAAFGVGERRYLERFRLHAPDR